MVGKRCSSFFLLATEKSTAFKEKQPWRMCVYLLLCLRFSGVVRNSLFTTDTPTPNTCHPECSDAGGIRTPLPLQWLKRPASPSTTLFFVGAGASRHVHRSVVAVRGMRGRIASQPSPKEFPRRLDPRFILQLFQNVSDGRHSRSDARCEQR